MKLSYANSIMSIDVKEDCVSTLIVENKQLFRKMVLELASQLTGEEGPWVLGDKEKLLSIDKSIHFVQNPLCTDMNQKSILTKLQKDLISTCNDLVVEVSQINQRLQSLYATLSASYPLELEYNEYATAQDLIKLGGFSFYQMPTDDLLGLLSYIEVVNDLLHPPLFVLVNLGAIANCDELQVFYKSITAKNINVICLESNVDNLGPIDKNRENRYILDKDYCLL